MRKPPPADHNPTTTARAEQILELLVAGLARRDIIKWVEAKAEWKASPATIDRLVAIAGEMLEAQAAPHRERELNKALRRLDMLFARCMQITDFKGALAVEKERIALLNLSGNRPAEAKTELRIVRLNAEAKSV